MNKVAMCLCLGLLAAGCPTNTRPDDNTCDQLIECVTEVAPGDVGDMLDSYGPDGSCWESSESADICIEACFQAMQDMRAVDPDALECYPEDSTRILLGYERDWDFEQVGDCEVDEFSSFGVKMYGYGGSDFTLRVMENNHDKLVDLDCELDGTDFECGTDVHGGGSFKPFVSMEGSFGSDYATADSTAVHDDFGEEISCQYSGVVD